MIIVSKSFVAPAYLTMYPRRKLSERLLQWWILGPSFVYIIRVYKVLRRIQQSQPGTPGRTLFFSLSALGSFTCVTKHMGRTALRPIRRTNQWLKVFCLKDTSVTAWITLELTSFCRSSGALSFMMSLARPYFGCFWRSRSMEVPKRAWKLGIFLEQLKRHKDWDP